MNRWKDMIDEEVNSAHRQKIFMAVAPELRQRRSRRSFIWKSFSLGLASLAAVFGVILFKKNNLPEPSDLMNLGLWQPYADNEELIADLDLVEDLEVLEQWDPS